MYAGAQDHELFSAVPGHRQGASWKVEQLGHKLAPVWGVGTAGRGLACQAAVPAPADCSLTPEMQYSSCA